MWQDGEVGPTCFCGSPMVVHFNKEKKASLICICHSTSGAASFPLPKKKPECWPKLTENEVRILIKEGEKEYIAAK